MRIAHFSDIHITADSSAIPWRAMLSKRIVGWLNLQLLGRKGVVCLEVVDGVQD